MRPLSAAELLDAWERGLEQPRALRMLGVLAAASPDCPADAVASLSIGARDRRLLQIRAWAFGAQLLSIAACPACRERVEWRIDAIDLLARGDATSDVGELCLDLNGHTVRFRLPNSLDLAAASACADVSSARRVLIDRCVADATPALDDGVPPEIADALAARMEQADPGVEAEFALTCPACAHAWTVAFDIESFFWTELHAWAQRTLNDVHTLARAYGWREADILAMAASRRHTYLGFIGA